ncbi:M28 family metallopeptidase [Verrucomicrobiota bacterium]
MRINYSALFLSILLCYLCSCRQETEPVKSPAQFDPFMFSGTKALEEVCDFVAIGPRHSGTKGAKKAAAYLAKRLEEIGIEPLIDEFTDLTPRGEVTFRNIMGIIQGTENKSIIIASHYDTKSGISKDFIGANDSGSSTGLLLELAELFLMHTNNTSPGPSIIIVFFDGEECMEQYGENDGLHGSKHLAKTLLQNQRADNVIAVIVADMIGDKNLSVTLPRNSTAELTSLVFKSAREEGARLKFSLAHSNIRDDHVPFLKAGMPVVNIIDLEFGSAPGKNDYWHTPEDTLDKLSEKSLETVGRVVIRTVNKLMVNYPF